MADFGANVLSSSVALLGLLVIMGLIYTIWSQINMKKKQKYFKELHTELKPGQEVLSPAVSTEPSKASKARRSRSKSDPEPS